MKISIITVCFNAASTIKQAVESVLSQSYPDIEYIIIDGGSDDGTLEILNSIHDKAKVVSGPDKGIYDAMNKGLALATGDVVGMLNADDFYTDEHVIEEVEEALRSSKAAECYADLDYVKAEDTSKVIRSWKSGEYTHGMFLRGWMPPHPTFFIRRVLVEKYGGYNRELSISADYEFMLRLIHLHKIELIYIPRTIIRMRTGGKSGASLSNRVVSSKEDIKAWKVNALAPPSFLTLKKKFRKVGQFFQ